MDRTLTSIRPQPPTGRVHPIVRFNYLIRLIGCPMGAGIVASVRFDEPTPAMVWAALLIYAFVWPHVVHGLGRRSGNPKRTEQYCLMLDCALVGVAASLVSFRLVPTVLLATGILTAVASFGGVPMLAAGLGVLGVTYLLGIVIIDWNTATQTPLITVALSLALAFLFQMLLALQTHRQAKALVQTRREIESQSQEILRQNEALAEAMHKAEDDRRAIEAATLAKSRFLANMSHELRTPLNAVIGYTELILDATYGEVPERVRATLLRVEHNGRHLLGLINEVLDLSKIEAGQLKLNMEEFSLPDSVRAVGTSVEGLAREKGVRLRIDVAPNLPRIRGDERRLAQVLFNVVGNAIKFTEKGEIDVRVAADGDGIAVTVRDTGPGVPAEASERIFEEFQQADSSTTRSKGGAGLGLAISRRIVELHGGKLRLLHSEVGRGSTFGFTIPCAGPPAAAPLVAPAEASPS